MRLDPGYQYQQLLTKKYANLGTLKGQASHNGVCCVTGYGSEGKVHMFKCFVCDSECKVSSIKTHLGGEKHHKKWKLLFNPMMDADELKLSYSTFCNIPTNKSYVSGRYHAAMAKKDPSYAAKRQQASTENPTRQLAPEAAPSEQPQPSMHSRTAPMHNSNIQPTGLMPTPASGSTPPQPDRLPNNQNNTGATTTGIGHPPDFRTQPQDPESQRSATSRCTRSSNNPLTDGDDGGIDDWVEEGPEKQTPVTDKQTPVTGLPGQTDPVNVSRRLAAIQFAKNWTLARPAGPENRRY